MPFLLVAEPLERLRDLCRRFALAGLDVAAPDDAIEPVTEPRQRADRVPAQAISDLRIAPFLFLPCLLQETRSLVQVVDHDQDVLAYAERVLDEIGAIAPALDRIDPMQRRAIRPRARAGSPGYVHPQQPALRRPRLHRRSSSFRADSSRAARRPSPRLASAIRWPVHTPVHGGPGDRPAGCRSAGPRVTSARDTPRYPRPELRFPRRSLPWYVRSHSTVARIVFGNRPIIPM